MTWQLDIENIAGIRSGAASIEPGVNAVRASNWQGKSSLLEAIETAMGTAATLTDGAERGRVELSAGDRTVVAELVRQEGRMVRRGDAYLFDERDRVLADLFAFLGDDNEIRRAVRTGENLESLVTRPLDFERLDERIADLRGEREQVEAELERATEAVERLPPLQERVTNLEVEIETLRAERDDLVASDEGAAQPAAKRDELSDARGERDRLEDQREQLESTIASTRERLETRREELDELTVPEADDLAAEIAEAREALSAIEQEVDLLQALYNANRRVLDADRLDVLADVEHGLVDDSLSCWVCGGDADRAAVEDQLEALADRLADRRQAVAEHREAVEALEERRASIRDRRRQQQDLETEIDELEATLADREESLASVDDRLDAANERLERLEGELEATDDRRTDLEGEIKFKQAALEEARDELEAVERQAARREQLAEERATLTEELEALRNRKQRVKDETRAAFDEAIRDLVDRLEPGFETARLTSTFDLVVAREGREVGLDALSEGEVELLGIVTALAGYEAFDVDEVVPVVLLDSVGELTSENLRPLVAYLAERTTYLVTTAYPEQDLAEDHRIDPTDWSVVSRDLRGEASS